MKTLIMVKLLSFSFDQHRKHLCISRTFLLLSQKSRVRLIHETIHLRALSHVSGAQTPSLSDCGVTKQKFCIILLCYFV